jgi:formylglycine-generating enzyme required for sulfatase activity
VQKFIEALNHKTGKKYRLPTEAEWEYAARGGAKSKKYKYAGSNKPEEVAWYQDNSGKQAKPQPVGTKRPNELGIYDMSGNVHEWVNDWHGGDYTASAKTNPQGPPSGRNRVYRGGFSSGLARDCRVSSRNYYFPDTPSASIGFRLALDP